MKRFFLVFAFLASASTSHALWNCSDAAGEYTVLLSNSYDLAIVTKVTGKMGGPAIGGELGCDTIDGMPAKYPATLAVCSELSVRDGGFSAAVVNDGNDLTLKLSQVSFFGETPLATLICSIKTN